MHEPPARSTRRSWTRRAKRRARTPLPPPREPQAPERSVLVLRREGGETLGAYETRYDIRHGYGEERTIIQP